MKIKFFLALAISAIVISTTAYSQKTIGSSGNMSRYEQAIYGDPIVLLLFGFINATYEKRIGDDNSLTIFGSYFHPVTDWTGYGIGASYRWYFDIFKDGKRAIEGFSVGPFLSISYWVFDAGEYHYSYDDGASVTLGAEVNYKFIFDNWVIEPNFKYGFVLNKLKGNNFEYTGLGCNFGYAW